MAVAKCITFLVVFVIGTYLTEEILALSLTGRKPRTRIRTGENDLNSFILLKIGF